MLIHEHIKPNTLEFTTIPMVRRLGFREYDARWRFPEEINLLGMQAIGAALATQLAKRQRPLEVIVGHDYRAYSAALKYALVTGLLAAGAQVYDIGLAVTPMAYFAQYHLNVDNLAMVTASHNENGWTGLKLAWQKSRTYGPHELKQLKQILFTGKFRRAHGSYQQRPAVRAAYLQDLIHGRHLANPVRVVVGTGHGTASAFTPAALRQIGCEVIDVYTNLDWDFPHGNPNPEELSYLAPIQEAVRTHQAALGLAVDGDGDRLGVVDENGDVVFSDKIGLLLARHICRQLPHSRFVVDIKSTGLFKNDPVLEEHGAEVEYCRSGHAYIKQRCQALRAAAGFERSGHFFLYPPYGRGYDDATLAAIMIITMLVQDNKSLCTHLKALPPTWQSPTISAFCPDEHKYGIVERLHRTYEQDWRANRLVAGEHIAELVTINGVRIEFVDGSWGLIRPSANKPALTIVVESPVSRQRLEAIFDDLRRRLELIAEVGAFDQGLEMLDQTAFNEMDT